jgi:putative transposase
MCPTLRGAHPCCLANSHRARMSWTAHPWHQFHLCLLLIPRGLVIPMLNPENTNTRYKRIKHFNHSGHIHFLTFSCYRRMPLLANDLWCSRLAESISRSLDKHDVALWAYVLMPDHVHLLVRPRSEIYDISGFLRSMKNSAAKRILNSLRDQRSAILDELRAKGLGADDLYRFWQAGPGYDKNIWTLEKALEKANYCHRNPVARGLVASPEDWKWSSYRSLELGHEDHEALRVDSWDDGFTSP